MTIAYRPIAFDGRLTPSDLVITVNGDASLSGTVPVEPLASVPPPCPAPSIDQPPDQPAASPFVTPRPDCQQLFQDGLAEVEVFDLGKQTWDRLPHLTGGNRYSVADPSRYMDPTSGTVLIRYVNDRADQVGFQVDVAITGTIE